MVYLEPTNRTVYPRNRADAFQVRSIDQSRLVKKLGLLLEPVMEETAAGVTICIE